MNDPGNPQLAMGPNPAEKGLPIKGIVPHSSTCEFEPMKDPASMDAPPPGISLVDQVVDLMEATGHRPSWDEYFMATAFLIASRSSCSRLNVGCVLVSGGNHKNRIITAGYNGFLPGAPHTSRVRDGHEQATVHAEQNAICDAARRGANIAGSTAYVTHFPCGHCARILAAAGVNTVKYHFDYKNDELVRDLFTESHVALEQF